MVKNILQEKDEYTGMNAAQACCRNGHMAILKKIVDMHEAICQIPDNDGNLALHHLCYNTTTKVGELRVMLEIIRKPFPGAKTKPNHGNGPLGEMTPMDILSQRLEEQNPYETNLYDCKEALLNGLSQVEIDDDQLAKRQTTFFGGGRGSEVEIPYENYHHT